MTTGAPPYDAQRTLLTTGIFDYVLVARGEGTGAALPTPDLGIVYTSYPDHAQPTRPSASPVSQRPATQRDKHWAQPLSADRCNRHKQSGAGDRMATAASDHHRTQTEITASDRSQRPPNDHSAAGPRPSGPSMDSTAVDDNWTTGGGRWSASE